MVHFNTFHLLFFPFIILGAVVLACGDNQVGVGTAQLCLISGSCFAASGTIFQSGQCRTNAVKDFGVTDFCGSYSSGASVTCDGSGQPTSVQPYPTTGPGPYASCQSASESCQSVPDAVFGGEWKGQIAWCCTLSWWLLQSSRVAARAHLRLAKLTQLNGPKAETSFYLSLL